MIRKRLAVFLLASVVMIGLTGCPHRHYHDHHPPPPPLDHHPGYDH